MGRPRVVKKFSKSIDANQGKLGDNNSYYKATYVAHKDFVPTKNVKPPPSPPLPRFPPMLGETTTMHSFVPQDVTSKREMIVPVEKHVVSNEPLSCVTEYRNEFPAKPVLPAILKRPKTDVDTSREHIRFDDRTVNKHFYQDWKPKRRKRYGEFPAFSSSVVHIDKRFAHDEGDVFKSRSHLDFSYKTIPKPQMVKAMEPNIKVGEGERNLETTHRSTYQFVPESQPAQSMKPSRKAKTSVPRKMEFTSKYQADFPRRNQYPQPPKPTTPAPDTLEIKMGNNHVFETEQRKQFHGWDVKEFPRPEPSKLRDNTELSNEPMQTKSTTNRDFTPKEVKMLRVVPADRPETNEVLFRGKFQNMTTNKSHYKDWSPHPRQRFGDFHETYKNMYLPPQLKPAHNFSTTTKSTFVEKHGRPRTSMKPPQNTIDTSEEHDFKTVSNTVYQYPPASAYEIEDFVIKC